MSKQHLQSWYGISNGVRVWCLPMGWITNWAGYRPSTASHFFFLHFFLTVTILGPNFWRLVTQSPHFRTCLSTGYDPFNFLLPIVGHFGLVHPYWGLGDSHFPGLWDNLEVPQVIQPLQLPIFIQSPDPMDFCLVSPPCLILFLCLDRLSSVTQTPLTPVFCDCFVPLCRLYWSILTWAFLLKVFMVCGLYHGYHVLFG